MQNGWLGRIKPLGMHESQPLQTLFLFANHTYTALFAIPNSQHEEKAGSRLELGNISVLFFFFASFFLGADGNET